MLRTVGGDEPLPGESTAPEGESNSNFLKDRPQIGLENVARCVESLQKALSGALVEESIRDIEDRCDELYYWALAESHFPDDISALGQCDAVEALTAALAVERSPVVIAALRALTPAVSHHGNRRIFAHATGIVDCLAVVMSRFPNKAEVQERAVALLTPLSVERAEAILESPLVSATLTAMTKHQSNSAVQEHGCKFLAAMAQRRRRDPKATPVAILFGHAEALLEVVLATATRHCTNLEIATPVAELLERLSDYSENADSLSGSNAIAVLHSVAMGHLHSPSTLTAALVALSHLSGEMVPAQKRETVFLAKKVISSVSNTTVLAACCALCQVLVDSSHPERRTILEASAARRAHVQHHETLVAQGKRTEAEPVPEFTDPEQTEETQRQWSEEWLQLKLFMSRELVPFVGLALQHFGEEDPVLARAASGCLRALTINKWDLLQ